MILLQILVHGVLIAKTSSSGERERKRGWGEEAEALLTEPRASGSEHGCSVNNVGEASSGKLKQFQFEQERKPFRCTNTTQTSKMSSLSHNHFQYDNKQSISQYCIMVM